MLIMVSSSRTSDEAAFHPPSLSYGPCFQPWLLGGAAVTVSSLAPVSAAH